MSRVGKKPIPLPAAVKVHIGEHLHVEGPNGKLTVPIPNGVRIEQDGNTLNILRDGDQYAALHGLTRALASNAVIGVSTGFTRELDIVGIGFKCESKHPGVLTFTLGYSHPIEFMLAKGIEARIDKLTHIVLTGFDRQVLGQAAANMRALRPPDPYKNKGVRYTGEVLRKKVGKSGATGKK